MKNNTKILAFCISEIHNDDVASMIFYLNRCLTENGWKLFVFNTATDLYKHSPFDNGESVIMHMIDNDYIDAICMFPRKFYDDELVDYIIDLSVKKNIPMIMIEGGKTYEGTVRVEFDESSALREVVNHLVDYHGVTDMYFMAGIKGNDVSENRLRVFKERLEAKGLPYRSDRIGYGDFYDMPTRREMEKLIAIGDMPEAIVCANDAMAVTVCEVLGDYGYVVPDDILVTGFDGSEEQKYTLPRIATCGRNMEHFAEFILSVITEAIDDLAGTIYRSKAHPYMFRYEFGCDESCGCKVSNIKKLSQEIAELYKIKQDDSLHGKSMNNMLSKLTNDYHMSSINQTVKYYMPLDGYLCMNADFYRNTNNIHHLDNPFDNNVIAYSFFKNEPDIIKYRIPTSEFIPEWDDCMRRNEPLVFVPVHNQEDIYGYIVAYLEGSKRADVVMGAKRLNRFIMNFNGGLSMFVQRSNLQMANRRMQEIQDAIIAGFAEMVESRDKYTGEHIKRTGSFLRILVDAMRHRDKYKDIITEHEAELMCKTAPLHDIGKIKVSDIILNKPGKLDPEEFEKIKEHASGGKELIDIVLAHVVDEDYIEMSRNMAMYHHERWDGTGYPDGLKGEEIPLCARIMAVVDVFDALTGERVYKKAYSVEKAYGIMQENSGTQFDPDIFDVFLDIRPQIETVISNMESRIHR